MAADLKSIILRAPGIKGLNLEGESTVADASFARVASNVVFDKAGRLCSRKGYSTFTSTPLTGTPNIESMIMSDTSSGNELVIGAEVSSNHKIYEAAPTGYATFTDRTGALTPSGSNWQFVTFNDKLIGAQSGETIISKAYGANAATIAGSGTIPSGNCIHSAFGRLWAQSGTASATTLQTIQYSVLLNETDWSAGGGGGEINVLGTASALATGYDELVAIGSVSAFLVVFMRNSIIIYNNPDDPSALGIEKIIQGVGCIARDSVQNVGDDIIFLSASGLRSLRETILSENNFELGEYTGLVRGQFMEDMDSSGSYTIKSVYDPEEALYLILAPEGDIWALDLHTIDPEQPTRFTRFIETSWSNFCYWEGDTYIGYNGTVGKYDGNQDDGSSFTVRWESTWVDFDVNQLKFLKKLSAVVEGAKAQTVTFLWSLDYGGSTGSASSTIENAADLAEYNVAEYNIAEYSGGIALDHLVVNSSRSGQVVSFGFSLPINGFAVCVEQLGIFVKLGREDR